jgi:hypothetical protein
MEEGTEGYQSTEYGSPASFRADVVVAFGLHARGDALPLQAADASIFDDAEDEIEGCFLVPGDATASHDE